MVADGAINRSNGSRVAGKNRLHELLKVDEHTELPEFNSLIPRQIIADLPTIPSDPKGSDDIDPRYTSDHAYDSVRYGIWVDLSFWFWVMPVNTFTPAVQYLVLINALMQPRQSVSRRPNRNRRRCALDEDGDVEEENTEYSRQLIYSISVRRAKDHRKTKTLVGWLSKLPRIYGPEVQFTDSEKSKAFVKITKTKVLALMLKS